MSSLNCDYFCQSKHLFVHEATSPMNFPVVLPISGELGELAEVGVVLSLFGTLRMATSWRKSDIAVRASDCLQNCPPPVSVPIHHHLSTIRTVMICRLEMDGDGGAVDGSDPGQCLISHGHHTRAFGSAKKEGRQIVESLGF